MNHETNTTLRRYEICYFAVFYVWWVGRLQLAVHSVTHFDRRGYDSAFQRIIYQLAGGLFPTVSSVLQMEQNAPRARLLASHNVYVSVLIMNGLHVGAWLRYENLLKVGQLHVCRDCWQVSFVPVWLIYTCLHTVVPSTFVVRPKELINTRWFYRGFHACLYNCAVTVSSLAHATGPTALCRLFR